MGGSQEQSRIYHPDLVVARDGHVTTVTIDRPEAKNACTGDMWVALGAMFREISYSGARVVVLTGAGGDFCAGADLGGGGGAEATTAPVVPAATTSTGCACSATSSWRCTTARSR